MTKKTEGSNKGKTTRTRKIEGKQPAEETKLKKVSPRKTTRAPKPKGTASAPKRHSKGNADRQAKKLLEQLAQAEDKSAPYGENLGYEVPCEVPLEKPRRKSQPKANKASDRETHSRVEDEPQESTVDPFAGSTGCNFVLNPKEETKLQKFFRIALDVLKEIWKIICEIVKALSEELDRAQKKAEVVSAANAKLAKETVTWESTAQADVVFERILTQYRLCAPGFASRRWNSITPSPATLQIFFQADWREKDPNSNWMFETTVQMQLQVVPKQTSGCEVQCRYFRQSNNLMNMDAHADSLIKNTNYVIRELCSRP